jgi:hypothetical protein
MQRLFFRISIAALFLGAGAAQATITSYTTLAAWQAAATSGTQTNISLTSLPGNDAFVSSATVSGVTFSGNLQECSGTFPSSCTGTGGTTYLIGSNSITVTPPSNVNVSAVAGDFAAYYGNTPQTVTITVYLYSGITQTVTINPGNAVSFIGFVSSNPADPVNYVTFTETGNSSNYAALMDFSYFSSAYPALSISTPSPLPNALAGTSYQNTMAASGGSGNYSFSATGLPTGLTIATSGVISGTPTAVGVAIPVSIKVADTRSGARIAKQFYLTVSGRPQSSFQTVTTYNVSGNASQEVVTGDFNGDGFADFAVANFGTGNVSVMLGNGVGGFGSLSFVTAGAGPCGIATGDFDGDGKLDLAVNNCNAGTISILLGNGNGGFTVGTPITTGVTGSPNGIAVADFDGDGNADIAVTSYGNGTAIVEFGGGDGTFNTPTILNAGSNPIALVAADLNGDGLPDLAVTNYGSNNVSVFMNTGSRHFAGAVNYTTNNALGSLGVGPNSIAAADLNNDGKLDLVTANYSSATLSIFINQGSGTFAANPNTILSLPSGVTKPDFVTAGDFNGDGLPDLATASFATQNVTVFLNTGSANFGAGTNYTTGVISGNLGTSLVVADFNGDGLSDLAVSNYTAGSVSVLLGTNTTTTITSLTPNPSLYGGSVSIVANISPTTATGTVSFQDGGSTFATSSVQTGGVAATNYAYLPLGSNSITAVYSGDSVNGASTSSASVLTVNQTTTTTTLTSSANPSGQGLSITLTATVAPPSGFFIPTGSVQFKDGGTNLGSPVTLINGVATLATSTLTLGSHTLTAVYSGDVNDLTSTSNTVTQVIKTATAAVLTSSANPQLSGQPITFTATIAPSAATGTVNFTVDGSSIGTPGLVSGVATVVTSTLSAGSHTVIATYSGDSTYAGSVSNSITQRVGTVTTTTLNVSPAGGSNNLGALVTITATVAPSSSGVVTFYNGAQVLGTTALNGSSVATLATKLLPAGKDKLSAFYPGSGSSLPSTATVTTQTVNSKTQNGFGSGVSYNAGTTPWGVVTGDFNGDGYTDVAVANYGSGTVSVYLGAANGTFGTPTTVTVGAGAIGIAAGDFNVDGHTDLAVTNYNDNSVSILLGDGSGNFPTVNTVTSAGIGSQPEGIVAADFDGDGLPDLAIANNGSNTIAILRNTGSGNFADTGTTYTTGIRPGGIVAGDFNNDGILDIAVSNFGNADIAGSVSVFFGQGHATFGTAANAPTGGTGSYTLVAYDFDGDGNLDLAVPNATSNNLSVMLGSANGVFSNYTTETTGNAPESVAVGDFNGDGKIDIAVTNDGDSSVTILPGLGNGAFFFGNTYSAATGDTGGRGIAVGDFNGDGVSDIVFSNASSGTISVLLGLAQTTTTITSSSVNPSIYGQSTTLTATVTPSSATGTITFFDGGLNLGQATLVSGSASLSTNVIPGGAQSLTAIYSGDAGNQSSTSSPFTQTVNPVSTTTTLTSSQNPSNSGQPVTFTAQVAPVTLGAYPTGTVTFIVNGSALATANVAGNGTAFITTNAFYIGGNSVFASYSGDGNNAGSNSSVLTQNVVNTTSVTLTSSKNPASPGLHITLIATVCCSEGMLSGTVTFYDGGTVIGGPVNPVQSGGGAVATATVSLLSVGSHQLTAVYSGDTGDGGSTSPALNEQVLASPTISLNSSPSSPVFGQQVTLAATLTPSTATGFVTFFDGVTYLGSGALSSGQVSVKTTLLGPGHHPINVSYGGDVNNGPALFQSTVSVGTTPQSGFHPFTNYTVGSSTYASAVGDFNGDGIEDLAISNASCLSFVSILIGNGDGTFKPPVSYTAGNNVSAIAVADMNQDGKQDLIIATISGTYVLLGTGTGTFGSPNSFDSNSANSVAIGDFNGDGIPDMVEGLTGGGIVTFLGNGDGTLTSNGGAGGSIYGGNAVVATTDLNGDTIADIVLADNLGNVVVFLGNGDGSFQNAVFYQSNTIPSSIAVADFNKDGNMDIVLGNDGELDHGAVTIMLGSANGTLGTPTNFTVQAGGAPQQVAVGDFNGDGNLDLAVGDTNNPFLYVLAGNGNGTFQTAVGYALANTAYTVSVGNFTGGSGRGDIVAGYGSKGDIGVLLSDLSQTISFGTIPNQTLAASPLTISATATSGLPVTFSTQKLINVQFGCTAGSNCFGYSGNASSVAQTGAAVIGNAGDTWNLVSGTGGLGTTGSNVALVDSTGTASPVTVSWISDTFYYSGNNPGGFGGTPLINLMNGYLVNHNATPETITIAGLVPNAPYSLYMITQGDAGAPGRQTQFSVNSGAPLTTSPGANSNLFITGQNYVVLNATADASGVLTVSYAAASGEADVNGFQLVASSSVCSVSGTTVTLLATGTCTILATQGGNAIYGTATASQSFAVTANSTATTLTTSSNPATLGQSIALTATVTPATATGTVNFLDGASTIASVSLLNGVAIYNTNSLTLGSHSLHTTYAGDANDTGSNSNSITEQVNKIPTTTTLTSSVNPTNFGQSTTFTATVSPSTATGTVTFLDGASSIGTGTLSGGTATFATGTLAVGAHSITAVYGSDASNAGSTSTALTQTVNPVPTITGIVKAPDGSGPPLAPGSFATINGSDLAASSQSAGTPYPTTLGNVSITVNGVAAPLAFVSANQVNFQIPYGTPTGSVTVVLTNNGLVSNTFSVTIAPAAPALYSQIQNQGGGTNASGTPAIAGTTVLVHFTGLGVVSPPVADGAAAPASPASTSAFTTTASVNGTAATTTNVMLAPGAAAQAQASIQIPAGLTTGNYPLTITINGVTSQAATIYVSTPPALSITTASPLPAGTFGTGYSTTLAATGGSGFASNYQWTSSTLPSGLNIGLTTGTISGVPLAAGVFSGVSITVTDTATGQSTPQTFSLTINPGATSTTLTSSVNPSTFGQSVTFTATVAPATATGTVTFLDGGIAIGTGSVISGTATFATTALSVNAHAITAVYGGDSNDSTSTSSALTQTVNQGPTTTTLTSSLNPAIVGQSITLTATVSPSSATGTVTFNDGATSIGTGTLSGGSAALAVSSLSIATHSITAVYGGDASDAGSTSAALSQVVNPIPNLVTNGDFQTTIPGGSHPSIPGWSRADNVVGSTESQFDSPLVGCGFNSTQCAQLDAGGAGATISQTLSTTPGQIYLLTFMADNSTAGQPNFLNVLWDGAQVTGLTQTNTPNVTYQQYTATVVASNASTVLAFSTSAAGNGWFLDNVSVTAATGLPLITSIAPATGTASGGTALTLTGQNFTGATSVTIGGVPATAVAVINGGTGITATSPAGAMGLADVVVTTPAGNNGSSTAYTYQAVPSTTSLTSSPNPSTTGQNVTLTATVTPGATGTVNFYQNVSSLLGTATLNGGTPNTATLIVGTFSAGAIPLSATYNGDTTYGTSSSSTVTQTVVNTTSTTLTSSTNPSTFGQSVTFTATVVPGTATGTVTFLDGGTAIGTGTLSGGTATFITGTLSVTSHPITAVYGGDALDTSSTSSQLNQIVNRAPTTTTITSSVNPSVYGQSVTLTATVSPSTATGTVGFFDGTTSVGSGSVSGGVATFTSTVIPVGSHSFTATYNADANDLASTSAVVIQVVNKAASTTTLTSSLNPALFNQAVTLTASVLPSTAAGTVTFFDGATSIGTGTLSLGTATLTVSSLSTGSHSLTATYAGDANDLASTSTVVPQTISQASSTISLTSSQNPSLAGNSITLTATVLPSSATGTATFFDGATQLGSPVTLAGGSAAFTTATLLPGAHTLSVSYSGDANYTASNSGNSGTSLNFTSATPGTITDLNAQGTGFTTRLSGTGGSLAANDPNLTLNTGPGTLTLRSTAADLNGQGNIANAEFIGIPLTSLGIGATTDFTVSATFNSVQYSQNYDQFGIFVGADSTSAVRGGGLFVNAPTAYTTQTTGGADANQQESSVLAPNQGDNVILTLSRTAGNWTFTIQNLTTPSKSGSIPVVQPSYLAGLSNLVAGVFADNPGNTTSKTQTIRSFTITTATLQTVASNTTSTTLTSSLNPSISGQAVTLTATVTPSTATGFVNFIDGTTTLGTGTLTSGVATFTTSSLAVGNHSVTASYTGDTNDLSGSSVVLTQVVGRNSTTTRLTSSSSSALAGTPITLTATVLPSTATGTVTFKDGTTSIGTGTLSGGSAAITTSSFAAGAHFLTAVYNGDVSDLASTSPSLTQSITYPQLSIITSSLPAGQTGVSYGPISMLATGGSGSYTWTAGGLPAGLSMSSSGGLSGTPSTGFNGTVFVSLSDTAANLSTTTAYSLVITSALTISGTGNLGSVVAGNPVSGSFTASGGTPPYTWSVSGGLSVSSSGRVTGNSGAPGNYNVILSLTDSAQATTTLGLTYSAFGITTTSLPPATTSGPYSATIVAAGGAAPYSFTITGLPAGLTASGGTISGLPTTPGSSSITVVARDGGGLSVTANYSLVVTGAGPLSILSTSLPPGIAGQPYSQIVSASGGNPAYTWTQTGGSMPAGLSLSSSGTVSGQPTTPGSYTLGVQVTDSTGGKAVSSVTLNISPAPLTITSGATLPAGIANAQYPSQLLTASGGVAPYTFSLKGSLPDGLAMLNSQISGTPSTAGTYAFTVIATDSATPPITGTLNMSVAIRGNAPDLVLGAASAGFALTSGTTDAPSPNTVAVTSSVDGQVLNFTADASSVPWLAVSGGSSTPATLSIGLSSAALSLTPAGSPYSGNVTVKCTSSACSGSTQTIAVTVTVANAPPQLSVGSQLLSFSAASSNPVASSMTLGVQNSGGGLLNITSISAADSWLTVGGFPATVAPGPGASVTITANPGSLPAGFYTSTITVTTAVGNATVPVTLLISANSTMSLGPAGAQFSMPQGGALGSSSGSFLVSIASSTPLSYTASVLPGASWLTGGGSGSASSSGPGRVSYSIDPAAVKLLSAGAYYATIRVAGSGIVNTPLDYQIVLSISPASTPVVADPQPAGLIFLSSTPGPLSPQAVQVLASSTTPLPFQVSSAMADGSGWLSIDHTTGTTVAGAPASVNVSVNSAGLKPGVYRGTVSFATGTAIRTVNVTLVVELAGSASSPTSSSTSSSASSSTSSITTRLHPSDAGPVCAGGQLVATQTGLVSNFAAPASWPTPIAITLVDTCGSIIGAGQIVATFSNGDPPLQLAVVDASKGQYSGTWTPRKTSTQTTITAHASATGYTQATVQIVGKVTPNAVPTLAPNGTFDVFHPQVGAGLGPGNIVQIYGTALASQPISASTLPLPTEVGGTQVLIGGVQSPLFYVSPGQVNAQIPFELQAGQQYQVIVSANGALTAPQAIQLNAGTPAILQFTSGLIVAQHQDASLVSDTSPASPGEYLTLYMSGLGATDIPVASGQPSPSNPPANVLDQPTLTLNGTQVPLAFAGLTPGLVGLYQINVQIPAGLPDGSYEVVVTQDGVNSNSTLLPVKTGN